MKRGVRQRVATGVAAFTGSITNTVLFLGAMYLVFLPEAEQLAQAFQTTPELLLGAVAIVGGNKRPARGGGSPCCCASPIIWALQKYVKRGVHPHKTEN